jgi:hypothetical protein
MMISFVPPAGKVRKRRPLLHHGLIVESVANVANVRTILKGIYNRVPHYVPYYEGQLFGGVIACVQI